MTTDHDAHMLVQKLFSLKYVYSGEYIKELLKRIQVLTLIYIKILVKSGEDEITNKTGG